MRCRRPNSLKCSPLSQNQVFLIMPHGRLATAVGPQVECTVIVLLARVVSMKYQRVCDVGGVKVNTQRGLTVLCRGRGLTQDCSSLSTPRTCHSCCSCPKGGNVKNLEKCSVIAAPSVVPLSIMAVRLSRAETVSSFGGCRHQTLWGHRPKGGIKVPVRRMAAAGAIVNGQGEKRVFLQQMQGKGVK
jgi:hypothetical protein